MGSLKATALVHSHIHHHGTRLQRFQHISGHQVRGFSTWYQHRAYYQIYLRGQLADIVAVAYHRAHIGRHYIRKIAQAGQAHIQYRHFRTKASGHFGGLCAHYSATKYQHFSRFHTWYTTQQNATALQWFLQILCPFLYAHAASYFAHRHQQR